jgi:hypothetical protein
VLVSSGELSGTEYVAETRGVAGLGVSVELLTGGELTPSPVLIHPISLENDTEREVNECVCVIEDTLNGASVFCAWFGLVWSRVFVRRVVLDTTKVLRVLVRADGETKREDPELA